MKIILSRKGFDSSSGGCPNPIMPDGTLLSLPIPDNNSTDKYNDLIYGNFTYDKILKGLKPNTVFTKCHLDPDIREGVRLKPIVNWKPAFGQAESALGVLRNNGVEIGDLFLFFGLFQNTKYFGDTIQFIKNEKPIQAVFGYMQVGRIIDTPEGISKFPWHPHANSRFDADKNALYIPSEKLSFLPELPGYGVFSFRRDRVLTMPGKNTATWVEYNFLMPYNIYGNRKSSSKDGGIYYAGQWQELVLKENAEAEKWAKSLIEENEGKNANKLP